MFCMKSAGRSSATSGPKAFCWNLKAKPVRRNDVFLPHAA
jgi:hypothetical protein